MSSESNNDGRCHLGLVVVGHVDAGKSTTVGRLLFELGGINARDLDKLKEQASSLGKDSFMYAYVMDQTKESRTRGVTIACSTKEFFTNSYHYTIIDAPGHSDFIKNMISGASQADVALLMVPANKGGFEKSIAKANHKKGDIQGQTRQHARLCHLLGIEQLIVAINKMDEKSVNYSEERYNEIKNEVSKMLTKIGYKTKKIPFIPISGWKGDNLSNKSDNMPWYNGFEIKIKKDNIVKGVTLLDALDKVIKPPKRAIDNVPLRLPVSGVFKKQGIGNIITGRIEQGYLLPNLNVKFYPSNATGKVFSIEMHHKTVEKAECGDNIGLCVRGLNKDNMPRVGDIMTIDDSKIDPNPPKQCNNFDCLVFVQDHPGKLKCSDSNGKGGFTPLIHVRTAKSPCKMIDIKWKIGKSTNNIKIENPKYIEAGDQAEVTFMPLKPIVVTRFEDCKPLARIAAIESKSLVMLGKVINVEHKT